jgi:acyl-CoA synthetase (NDP forming)
MPFDDTPAGFDRLLNPRVIAVAGVSTKGTGPGARYLRTLKAYSYPGNVYVVHPTAQSVEGVPAVTSLADLPEPADYAFIATPADAAIKLIEAADGNVGFAQVMASGFGEDVENASEGASRVEQLLSAASAGGVRVLGPNCLGTHSPRGRFTFVQGASSRAGSVGFVCQSGGLGIDIVRRGDERGIGFSGLVTVGNCVDVSIAELLDFYAADDMTSVIGVYVESVRDGRAFFEALRRACSVKPVVILKGGRTAQGSRAAASHTGALTSDDRVWQGMAAQVGAALVDNLDDLLDSLLLLQNTADDEHGSELADVALFGNGGGTSVLASDALGRSGFRLADLDEATVQRMVALELPPGTGLRNPVDTPAGALSREDGKLVGAILDSLVADDAVQALIMHLNLAVILTSSDKPDLMVGNIVEAIRSFARQRADTKPFLLALRSDGSEGVDAARRSAIAGLADDRISVYPEIQPAIRALESLRTIRRAPRQSGQQLSSSSPEGADRANGDAR